MSDIGLSGTAGETGKKKTASSSAVATEHFDPLASAHDRFSLSYSFFFLAPTFSHFLVMMKHRSLSH